MTELRAAQAGDISAIAAIDPHTPGRPRRSMRELLRSEGWSPSGVLTGLDEGDPEHLFFHHALPAA
jgi:hypothetical protein